VSDRFGVVAGRLIPRREKRSSNTAAVAAEARKPPRSWLVWREGRLPLVGRRGVEAAGSTNLEKDG